MRIEVGHIVTNSASHLSPEKHTPVDHSNTTTAERDLPGKAGNIS